MSESFWFLTDEREPERPAAQGVSQDVLSDCAPFQESMRGDRTRPQRAPSSDQKRVRRQIHRSGGAHGQHGYERATDWDAVHSDEGSRIHRTLHIDPEQDTDGFDLWRGMGTGPHALPDHEVAHRLLKLVTQHPHLGMHWTADEGHAYRIGGDPGWGSGQSWAADHGPERSERSGLESPVVVHARWPHRDHIETDPDTLRRYDVKSFHDPQAMAQESEVPIKTGAPVEITGLSWANGPTSNPGAYRHHTFDEPVRHLGAKTATVLNTQIERLNKDDQIRTPTGQTSTVKRIRPHETDSTLMYLDTDMGTSTVKRGTDFQVVPHNSQQQELPDTGNPMGMGNSAELPGAGHTPSGPAGSSGKQPSTGTCPNCGNTGSLHIQGSMYVCSVCGFTVNAKGAPGNLLFTDQPHGYMPGRRRPGEVPKAHVWASKYETTTQESQIARRARQVLGGEQ